MGILVLEEWMRWGELIKVKSFWPHRIIFDFKGVFRVVYCLCSEGYGRTLFSHVSSGVRTVVRN